MNVNSIDYVLDGITRFRSTLDAHTKQFECFDKHAIQVEGWLKGEIVLFFDNEKTGKKLGEFETEVGSGSGRKKVDCFLRLHGTPIWIELKHWQIGRQKKQLWKAQNYFGDEKSIGICTDVKKLSNISDGDKYILILATKNPGYEDWSKGVDKLNEKFKPLHIKSYTNPSDFPYSYFLGLLEVV